MAPRRQGATGEREPEELRGCCVPGECLRPRDPVRVEDAVRVLCNNDTCAAGRYMHRECFEQWEAGVLAYLKSCGRARSWSERQRHQNLWTKKGYDLAFKACGCRCGRGHLKKDLDWAPPGVIRSDDEKKRRRRARSGRAPPPQDCRGRAFSMSSCGSCSPPSAPSEPSASPTHALSLAITPGKKNSKPEIVSDRIRAGAGANGIFSRRQDFSTFNLLPKYKVNSYQIKVLTSVRLMADGSYQRGTGQDHGLAIAQTTVSKYLTQVTGAIVRILMPKWIVFPGTEQARQNVSRGFLAKHGLPDILGAIDCTHVDIFPPPFPAGVQYKNRKGRSSINVQLIEDEGNHGNDDTRLFILSTLAGQHRPRVSCVLCEETMHVFDRYPLVDGTFFLSPRQQISSAVEVKVDGRTQYLTCVCMGCLERCDPERTIRCRFCGQKWDGASLVLGTMYSYDIFMAMPCCTERLKCNSCHKPLLHPTQRLNYSDYSHAITCPHCRSLDTHFVKPLSYCYTKRVYPLFQQWP